MGLVRYARPVAGDPLGFADWTVVGAAAAWDAIDDPHGTITVRGTGGGVTTDIADDSSYIEIVGPSGGLRHNFIFGPTCGDDDISNVTFHVRAKLGVAGSEPVNIIRRSGGNDFAAGAVTITSTAFAEYTLASSVDPVTGNAWTVDVLGLSPNLGFSHSGLGAGQSIRISRFYIEVPFTVGPTLGKSKREENWRYCDVCGYKHPYSRLQRPVAPHPQAGLVVCPYCLDEPDHDTLKIMNKTVPQDRQDPLY